jgi:hypothetical protein
MIGKFAECFFHHSAKDVITRTPNVEIEKDSGIILAIATKTISIPNVTAVRFRLDGSSNPTRVGIV